RRHAVPGRPGGPALGAAARGQRAAPPLRAHVPERGPGGAAAGDRHRGPGAGAAAARGRRPPGGGAGGRGPPLRAPRRGPDPAGGPVLRHGLVRLHYPHRLAALARRTDGAGGAEVGSRGHLPCTAAVAARRGTAPPGTGRRITTRISISGELLFFGHEYAR